MFSIEISYIFKDFEIGIEFLTFFTSASSILDILLPPNTKEHLKLLKYFK